MKEKMFAPSALYAVTGIRDGTFRAQKARDVYADLGITADGESGRDSVYSLEQIVVIAAALKLGKAGVELRDAVGVITPVISDLGVWVEQARQAMAEWEEEAKDCPELKGYKLSLTAHMTATFLLWKSEPSGPGGARWSLAAINGKNGISTEMASVAPDHLAIFIDLGRIAGEVVWTLVQGGAMSMKEL